MKARLEKLKWRARRGMLELDTLFSEYLSQHGTGLNDEQLENLERLLELQDQTLFDAFSGKHQLEDETLNQLLAQMKRL